jgi:hypothetical protein
MRMWYEQLSPPLFFLSNPYPVSPIARGGLSDSATFHLCWPGDLAAATRLDDSLFKVKLSGGDWAPLRRNSHLCVDDRLHVERGASDEFILTFQYTEVNLGAPEPVRCYSFCSRVDPLLTC